MAKKCSNKMLFSDTNRRHCGLRLLWWMNRKARPPGAGAWGQQLKRFDTRLDCCQGFFQAFAAGADVQSHKSAALLAELQPRA